MSRCASMGVGLLYINFSFELVSAYDDIAVNLLTSSVDGKLVTLMTRRVITLQESDGYSIPLKLAYMDACECALKSFTVLMFFCMCNHRYLKAGTENLSIMGYSGISIMGCKRILYLGLLYQYLMSNCYCQNILQRVWFP